MKKFLLIFLSLLLFSLFPLLFQACDGDDDNDDDSSDDGDDNDDDDNDNDNDDNDDNDNDNDDNNDDNNDDDLHPPLISNAHWDPDPASWDHDYGWLSYIMFGVCDPDSDLEGGAIYAYLHGTSELIWDDPIYWQTIFDPIDDCDAPIQVGVGKIFAETVEPPGWNINYCVDLVVSDGAGLFSNMEMNLCVYVP